MKKVNEVINETENVVVMDNETMLAIIEDNMNIVPKNQRKKFDAMTLEQKVKKIELYQTFERMRAEAKERNRMVNKVKDLFERRKASVEDAKEVLQYCTQFIDNFKQHQIEEIDKKIAELEEMKMHL